MDISEKILEKFPELKKYEDLPPCPKCGSGVEWSNSRDINVLYSGIGCTHDDCDLIVFHVESMAFNDHRVECIDYLTTVMKYCQWAETMPESYIDDYWVHYLKKGKK
jgi:hypothetical protein